MNVMRTSSLFLSRFTCECHTKALCLFTCCDSLVMTRCVRLVTNQPVITVGSAVAAREVFVRVLVFLCMCPGTYKYRKNRS